MAGDQAKDQTPFLGVTVSGSTPLGSFPVHLQRHTLCTYLLHPWDRGQ